MQTPSNLRALIGQLFLCGFDGLACPPRLRAWIEGGDCSGVILFSRNLALSDPAQIASLTESVRECDGPLPPFVAVDQEGGRVARLRAPFTELPPAAVLGEIHEEETAHRYAALLGQEAAAAGFNFVFAPVLDVHTNPDNPVIGDRALATQPAAVARLGWAYAEGLMSAGVMPCGKHFPGHGDTDVDSHLALPTLPHNLERLREVEWPPFLHAVRQGIPSLMTAHVLFPALDSTWPATLSPRLLHDVLREEWGFDGVICSDDLEMKGVAAHYSLEEIVVQGLKAGVDLFLLCHHWEELPRALQAIEDAVLQGVLTEDRLLRSYERIRSAKIRFCSAAQPQHLPPSELGEWLEARDSEREWAQELRLRWESRNQNQLQAENICP